MVAKILITLEHSNCKGKRWFVDLQENHPLYGYSYRLNAFLGGVNNTDNIKPCTVVANDIPVDLESVFKKDSGYCVKGGYRYYNGVVDIDRLLKFNYSQAAKKDNQSDLTYLDYLGPEFITHLRNLKDQAVTRILFGFE